MWPSCCQTKVCPGIGPRVPGLGWAGLCPRAELAWAGAQGRAEQGGLSRVGRLRGLGQEGKGGLGEGTGEAPREGPARLSLLSAHGNGGRRAEPGLGRARAESTQGLALALRSLSQVCAKRGCLRRRPELGQKMSCSASRFSTSLSKRMVLFQIWNARRMVTTPTENRLQPLVIQ